MRRVKASGLNAYSRIQVDGAPNLPGDSDPITSRSQAPQLCFNLSV